MSSEVKEIVAFNVTRLIADALGHQVYNVKPESNLIKDLGADSLDHIELTVLFEDEFEIEILDKEWENLKTVENIVDFIIDKLND